MKYNGSVYRSFAMITQLGLSMLAPVFLCTFAGAFLENQFQVPTTLPLILLGILAGARNVYVLARSVAKGQKERERDIPSGLDSSNYEKKGDGDVGDK